MLAAANVHASMMYIHKWLSAFASDEAHQGGPCAPGTRGCHRHQGSPCCSRSFCHGHSSLKAGGWRPGEPERMGESRAVWWRQERAGQPARLQRLVRKRCARCEARVGRQMLCSRAHMVCPTTSEGKLGHSATHCSRDAFKVLVCGRGTAIGQECGPKGASGTAIDVGPAVALICQAKAAGQCRPLAQRAAAVRPREAAAASRRRGGA